MKILFSGLPYFGKKLVRELSEMDPANKYIFCDTYYSRKDQLKFLFHLLTAKRVVSFNGASSSSGSLDWALRFKKKLIMQWHGSDVLTLRANKLGRNNSALKYTQQARSFTDASWLKDELGELGVEAAILHFKYVNASQDTRVFTHTNVVSYVAQDNEKFYGIAQIEKLAETFPETLFHIVGTNGKSMQPVSNIRYYGWVEKNELITLMDTNAIYLRLTEHDGYSLSVLEALANGNYVIWNNPHPCVSFVKDEASLATVFSDVQAMVEANKFERMTTNMDWIREHHNREKVLRNYVNVLTA